MTIETAAGARVPGEGAASGLSDDGLAILAFEREWWRLPGAKEAAVKQRFGLTSTQYHQQLNKIIDTPEALAADPILVKRLQRLRSGRRRG